MPNHQDRVAKNYEELCIKCLRYPNRAWDNEASYPYWCEGCLWRFYIKNGLCKMPNENIQQILDRHPI